MSFVTKVCRLCRKPQIVELDSDGRGGLVEETLPCGCEARRVAGICIDCRVAPVEGRVRVALRCGPCKAIIRRDYSRRWREKNVGAYERSLRRMNRKRRTKAGRAHRLEYERKRRAMPEVRARRNARRRVIAVKKPRQKAEYARRYKERHPERVREQNNRANQRRAAEKREYMHRYATKYVGEGKKPICRSCPAEIPYDGRGRPRLVCEKCDPARWRPRSKK